MNQQPTSGKISNTRSRSLARINNRGTSSNSTSSNRTSNSDSPKPTGVLRYPGGKTPAISILNGSIPDDVKEIVSPFFGGGSFELHCAQVRNIRVYAYDAFEPLINFWKMLKQKPVELVDDVKLLHPLSKEKFLDLRDNIVTKVPTSSDRNANTAFNLKRAAAFFAVNRGSFSGLTCSGGYSEDSAKNRFTLASIDKLLQINLENVYFECADFEVALNNHPRTFLFLDPPYKLPANKSTLYGVKGNLHRNFDHTRLARVLANSVNRNWMMCYNDCEEIRTLYNGCNIQSVNWKYGMSNNNHDSSEIIITPNTVEV